MAFPTTSETYTSLAVMIPNVWGEAINDFFKAKLVAAPFFVNRSSELADGGINLYTPGLTEMTGNTKSNASAVTLNGATESRQTLTVSTWKEVSFAIEDREAAQLMKSYELQKRYAKNAAYSAAKLLDTAVVTLFSSFTNSVGSSSANVADSDIRNAIAYLDSANVDSEEAAFFLHPNTFWKQIQGIDKFSLAINSPSNDPTAKQPQGYLYGRKVFTSSQVQYVSGTTGRYNALAIPDAIHWASLSLPNNGQNSMVGSMGVRVQSNYIPDYLSTITTADICYGTVLNRDTDGGVKILSAA